MIVYVGLDQSISDEEKAQQYVMYHKFYGKGFIIHSQTQPLFDSTYYSWFFNALFIAMGILFYFFFYRKINQLGIGKQVIFDQEVIGAPVPALESNIIVGATISVTNLYSLPLYNATFSVRYFCI